MLPLTSEPVCCKIHPSDSTDSIAEERRNKIRIIVDSAAQAELFSGPKIENASQLISRNQISAFFSLLSSPECNARNGAHYWRVLYSPKKQMVANLRQQLNFSSLSSAASSTERASEKEEEEEEGAS